jgi:hypothetical protein
MISTVLCPLNYRYMFSLKTNVNVPTAKKNVEKKTYF